MSLRRSSVCRSRDQSTIRLRDAKLRREGVVQPAFAGTTTTSTATSIVIGAVAVRWRGANFAASSVLLMVGGVDANASGSARIRSAEVPPMAVRSCPNRRSSASLRISDADSAEDRVVVRSTWRSRMGARGPGFDGAHSSLLATSWFRFSRRLHEM